MSNKFKRPPSYCFEFPTQEAAEDFIDFASQAVSNAMIQHPLSSNGQPIETQIVVKGSGSTIFDISLRNNLVTKATELNGHMV